MQHKYWKIALAPVWDSLNEVVAVRKKVWRQLKALCKEIGARDFAADFDGFGLIRTVKFDFAQDRYNKDDFKLVGALWVPRASNRDLVQKIREITAKCKSTDEARKIIGIESQISWTDSAFVMHHPVFVGHPLGAKTYVWHMVAPAEFRGSYAVRRISDIEFEKVIENRKCVKV